MPSFTKPGDRPDFYKMVSCECCSLAQNMHVSCVLAASVAAAAFVGFIHVIVDASCNC